MDKRKRDIVVGPLFTLVVLAIILSVFIEVPFFDTPKQYFGENKILTGAVLFLLIFLATVIAPLAIFPIVPVAAVFIGPFTAAAISILSWTFGATVAFLIARHLGRPVLERFVDMKDIARFERLIPESDEFILIILLRMFIPVDVLSYAIGLLSKVRLRVYVLATLIGVTPFTLLFTYGGEAFLERNYGTLFMLSILGVVVFILTLLTYRKRRNH